jgi:isopentenyl phosphate kinase
MFFKDEELIFQMDIDTILRKWDHAKKQKAIYDKECDRYKDAVERYMNKKDKNDVEGGIYSVSRRSNTRQILSKADTPVEIWNRYAKRFTYMSYHLKRTR